MARILVDLDAAKAARAEVDAEPIAFTYGGEEFALPAECPALFGLMVETDMRAAFEALLGPEEAARFFALRPSFQDLGALLKGIGPQYGFGEAGESSASGDSSPNGTKRSRPTSRAATG